MSTPPDEIWVDIRIAMQMPKEASAEMPEVQYIRADHVANIVKAAHRAGQDAEFFVQLLHATERQQLGDAVLQTGSLIGLTNYGRIFERVFHEETNSWDWAELESYDFTAEELGK